MIEINNLTNFAVDKKFFIGVAKKVLKGENREKENISIAFVSSVEIKRLNIQFLFHKLSFLFCFDLLRK